MKRLYLGTSMLLTVLSSAPSASMEKDLLQLGFPVINEGFPEGLPICNKDDLKQLWQRLNISNIPCELVSFLLKFSHLRFTGRNVITPQTIFHEHTIEMITTAWSYGVPKDYLPFCCDNADYYCVSLITGRVRFWSHYEEAFSDNFDDMWESFNAWVSKDWIPDMTRFRRLP
jgi:hypothetical protein